tara:strand:- start:334 stop:1023 length:690 start_codon:yes stop_codon:yes gene_type:complete
MTTSEKLLPLRSPDVPKDCFQITSVPYPANKNVQGRKDKLQYVWVFDPERPDKKCLVLLHHVAIALVEMGLLIRKSDAPYHSLYQGHLWEPDFSGHVYPEEKSIPPEEGWGDPDNIIEHPPVSYSAVPTKNQNKSSIQDCYTKTNGMILYKAQDPKCINRLADYFQIDPTLMHNIAQLTNAQNAAQFSLGVKDAPRAMDAQKIVVTAYIRSGQTSGGLPIDQDLIEAVS